VLTLIRQHLGRFILAIGLHLALFAALLLNVSFFSPNYVAPALRFAPEPVETIEAVVIELEAYQQLEREFRTAEQERIATALRAEEAQRREAERQRQEALRREQEAQRRREAEERARQEALRAAEEARQEALRLAEETRRLAEAERVRLEQERVAAEARIEQERRAAEARIEQERRAAEAERARAEAERRAAEEARQAAEALRRTQEAERQAREAAERRRAEEESRRREAQARELEEQRRREQMQQEQQRLAADQAAREAADRRAREDAARDAYIAQVQAAIMQRWRKPEGIRAGHEAFVNVRLNPETGRILGFTVQSCNGSQAFCDSVRQTMERLQILPQPRDPDMVRGGIRIRFAPD